MADRSFIIEILLKARDETAGAYASMLTKMKAFQDASKEEQHTIQGSSKAQSEYTDKLRKRVTAEEELGRALDDFKRRNKTAAVEADNLAKAQDRATTTLKQYSRTSQEGRNALNDLHLSQAQFVVTLMQTKRVSEQVARSEAARIEIASQNVARARQENENLIASYKQYQRLVDQVVRSEQAQERVAGARGRGAGQVKLHAEVDTKRARAEVDEFLLSQRGKQLKVPLHVVEEDVSAARRRMTAASSAGGGGGRGGGTGAGGGGGPIGGGGLEGLASTFGTLDTTTRGFDQSIRNAFGFATVALIQPLATMIVGLVGAFLSLASAAVAAGTALSATFMSAIVQGVPAMGLIAAAMQRLTQVISYVTLLQGQQQQRFIAGYQTAYQNALGINQVTVAEHSYSDSLYAVQQAQQQVGIAELSLMNARIQATRQLQDLIFAEETAKIQAEQSSLAITQSQKALRQAIATGGDVQSAQLNLQQAHVAHAQSVVQAQRAIGDAGQNSVARQQIAQQVTQAQRAVTQAQRSVVDAQFAAAQARAAIAQAQQAAAGFNVATAAQMAWLRSQMSATERALAHNIQQILGLFVGANSEIRHFTDQILAAFVPVTAKIYQLLRDPRIISAFSNLSGSIGKAITQVFNSLTTSGAIKQFISFINAAAANMKPLAEIATGLFRGIGAIAQAAIPFVHQFLGFIGTLVTQWSTWAASTRGQNWLSNWFRTAFQALQSFMGLGVAFLRLVAAVVGVGGGARTGIGLIVDLTKKINGLTDSITSHGKGFKTLQELWRSAKPALSAIGEVMGAVIHALLQIAGTTQGQRALKGIADFIAKVLIPAFTQMAINVGKVTSRITNFFEKHPQLAQLAKDFLGIALTVGILNKGIGLIFGPLAAVISTIGKLAGIIKIIDAEGGLGALFGSPIAAAAIAIAAAIVAISAATGNLGNLLKAVTGPFILLWKDLKPSLEGLGKAVTRLFNALGFHAKGAHDDVKILLQVLGEVGRIVATVVGGAFKIFLSILTSVVDTVTSFIHVVKNVFGGIFDVILGVVHGNFGRVVKGFERIGKGIWTAIKDAVLAIPKLLWNIFKDMVTAVLNFLGISSPSKKFRSIGDNIVHGLVGALEALPNAVLGIFKRIIKLVGSLWKDFKGIGSSVAHAIGTGLKDAANVVLGAIKWVINTVIITPLNAMIDVIRGAIDTWNSIPFAPHIDKPGHIHKLAHGGPVGGEGYGGGDRHRALLESGEHVWTKEEVRAAGGHGAVFALRRAFGGGGQGGPRGFQHGGAVTQAQQQAAQMLQGQNQGNQNTQGVTGSLGKSLLNILNFIKFFEADWKGMWQNLGRQTTLNTQAQYNLFWKLFNDVENLLKNFVKNTNQQFQTFYNNMKNVFQQVGKDTFNAFWYIANSANASLKAFGAKPVQVTLGQIPKFAGGGIVGNFGERGSDLVHAVLGRGEAVLNWAHQRFVDPALRKMYGFGLDKLFSKVRGEHAGPAGIVGGGHARENKFAAGGYVFPFPKNQPFSWMRIDQGQDLQTTPGGVVVAIAPGVVSQASDRFGGFGPFYPTEQITSGPLAGRGVYYGHTKIQRTGKVNAGDVIATTQPRANDWTAAPAGWLELGFLPYGSMNAGSAIAPILHALSQGHMVNAAGLASVGGAAAATWNAIKRLQVKGQGALKNVLQRAVDRATNAANAFGNKQAGQATGPSTGGQVGANWRGPWVSVMSQIARKFNWNLGDWKWVVNAESAGNPAAVNSSSGAFGLGQFLGGTAQAYAKFGALSRDPVKQIEAMAQYILDRYKNPTVAKAFHLAHNWYAKGGFAGGARPILAHVGEWVVNKAQQSKLANWLGASVEGVKGALGFTGGPSEFQGGGVVGDRRLAQSTERIAQGAQIKVTIDSGSVSRTGVYTPPQIAIDSGPFYAAALTVYNQAQRETVNRINASVRKNASKLTSAINQFINNYNQVGGDNGLFALAAQAISDFTTSQQSLVSFAAAGIRLIGQKLRRGPIPNAVTAARNDLAATNRIVAQLETLQRNEVTAFNSINREISNLGPNPERRHLALYQRLVGARNDLLTKIRDTDQNLSSNISDQYTKAAALFQAQTDLAMRAPTNLLTIAQGLQGVAQAFGRYGGPQGITHADQLVIQAYQEQQRALQRAYNQASARARRDPRWQTVADQLLSQLQGVIQSVAQAQAQALQDAISQTDTQGQVQQAAVDLANRLIAVQAALGNQLAAAQAQIGVARLNAAQLQGQYNTYAGLYQQAAAQGNIAAMQTLTQTMDNLAAQIAEANLQTQQLVTAYRELSISIVQAQVQAQSGFFSAANQISQTLGAIAGNQNLPALITYAKEAAQAIMNQGRLIVANIEATMQDPNQPFGQFQAQANIFLQQLVAAFNQGPQTFANALAQLAPQLSSFEAGLPQDQQQLFQNLIQALIDNSTSTVDNTQQLQQLNATSLQQQFQSSAWTMFREAIFNGLGGLLPQYALAVPSMDVGGLITRSGLLYGHKDETIVPAGVKMGADSGIGTNIEQLHFNVENPTEVADPVHLGNAIAWRLTHNPNSR